MRDNIILKKNPKIEFQLLDNGFKLIDGQTERNTGFYSYNDLQSIELNKVWFPRLAKWLRIIWRELGLREIYSRTYAGCSPYTSSIKRKPYCRTVAAATARPPFFARMRPPDMMGKK